MPIRTPNSPVIRDSSASLWAAIADGLVDSTDVSASGHLNVDLSEALPSPSPSNWAAGMNLTPFGMQSPPSHTPPRPAKTDAKSPIAPHAPKRPLRKALGELTNSHEVEVRILKLELADEESRHALARGIVSRFKQVASQIDSSGA